MTALLVKIWSRPIEPVTFSMTVVEPEKVTRSTKVGPETPTEPFSGNKSTFTSYAPSPTAEKLRWSALPPESIRVSIPHSFV